MSVANRCQLQVMLADQDKDKNMVRQYWYWNSGCPMGKANCSDKSWQKAKKWSLASREQCAKNMVDHLMIAGVHHMSKATAEEKVAEFEHEITQHDETWQEREDAREYERKEMMRKKAAKRGRDEGKSRAGKGRGGKAASGKEETGASGNATTCILGQGIAVGSIRKAAACSCQ